MTMVIGLMVLTAIPSVIGVAEAISSQKQQNAQMKEKIKFNMTATLSVDGGPPTEAWIVLLGGRVSYTLWYPPPGIVTLATPGGGGSYGIIPLSCSCLVPEGFADRWDVANRQPTCSANMGRLL